MVNFKRFGISQITSLSDFFVLATAPEATHAKEPRSSFRIYSQFGVPRPMVYSHFNRLGVAAIATSHPACKIAASRLASALTAAAHLRRSQDTVRPEGYPLRGLHPS